METLDILEFSLLRTAAAFYIPLTLFIITTAARRPDAFERYSWGVSSLGIVALVWLLNGYLNQNTIMLAFMYPLFFGFVALLGPAYYFSLVARRVNNLGNAILHVAPAGFIFTSALIGAVKAPLDQEQLELFFLSSDRLPAIAWSLLGDQYLTVLLLPLHFGAYAGAALWKTRDMRQAFLTLPLFLISIIFTWVYSGPGNQEWDIHLCVGAIEILLIVLFIYYFLTDTPKVQYERKEKLNIEPINYHEVIAFLEDIDHSEKMFCESKISLDRLAQVTNIEAITWRNYLNDEGLSFSDLKKKVRVNYALRLIEEGFLEKYTIDSLTETIGYSSRTSFYSAYKEVTGTNWSRTNN